MHFQLPSLGFPLRLLVVIVAAAAAGAAAAAAVLNHTSIYIGTFEL